jgi:hypothetical protein
VPRRASARARLRLAAPRLLPQAGSAAAEVGRARKEWASATSAARCSSASSPTAMRRRCSPASAPGSRLISPASLPGEPLASAPRPPSYRCVRGSGMLRKATGMVGEPLAFWGRIREIRVGLCSDFTDSSVPWMLQRNRYAMARPVRCVWFSFDFAVEMWWNSTWPATCA